MYPVADVDSSIHDFLGDLEADAAAGAGVPDNSGQWSELPGWTSALQARLPSFAAATGRFVAEAAAEIGGQEHLWKVRWAGHLSELDLRPTACATNCTVVVSTSIGNVSPEAMAKG